ncbi:hypothetical protein K3495_g217 [Podosphaera aphanis]|nr:hypothetical protein K3495_g217 [Podosphaera aphanis]
MLFAKAAQVIDMANERAANFNYTSYRVEFSPIAGYSNAETTGAAIGREGEM